MCICVDISHFLVLKPSWRLDAAGNSPFNAKIENQQKVEHIHTYVHASI